MSCLLSASVQAEKYTLHLLDARTLKKHTNILIMIWSNFFENEYSRSYCRFFIVMHKHVLFFFSENVRMTLSLFFFSSKNKKQSPSFCIKEKPIFIYYKVNWVINIVVNQQVYTSCLYYFSNLLANSVWILIHFQNYGNEKGKNLSGSLLHLEIMPSKQYIYNSCKLLY